MTVLLGIDIGTTTTKALAYQPESGKVLCVALRPTPVTRPQPEHSEHDPEALWQTVVECLREVMVRCAGQPVGGLAISSFAEAGLPVDENGEPLHPIIAWYDQRTWPQAAWWERHLSVEALHAITGQRSQPSFGVNKWLWILENFPDAAARLAIWLSVPDYILWKLTGTYATDFTIASRTMLFDQQAQAWSPDLLALAELSADQLPPPFPSGTCIGEVTGPASQHTGVPAGTPCVLGGHDHLCAAVAAGAYQPGRVIDSGGTAEAVLMVIPAFRSNPGIVSRGYACYSHVVPGQYVLKAGLKAAGGAVEWLVRQLAGPDVPQDALPYADLMAMAGQGIGQRAGPLWLPHLIGSGTPENDWRSLAALVGVRAEHDRGDLLRGLLESLAFWLRHNLEEMNGLTSQPPEQVILLGGTTRLHLLAQIKADILNRPMTMLEVPEAAATGAALLAGLGAKVFGTPSEAVESLRHAHTILPPIPGRAAWYERLYYEAYRPLYAALRDINYALADLSGGQEHTL